jgi:uncharacterized protein
MTNFCGRKIVVSALVGSHNYNLNTVNSDEDCKYFVMPTFEDLYHGKVFSTAEQSAEIDYDCHDVRQLGNLIWKANINFIEVLFSKDVWFDDGLAFLFNTPEKWASMNLPAFKNATYGMHLMKMKDLHKGTEKTDVLIEKFGYDTKQACHALRCLFVLEGYWNTRSMAQALWFEGDRRNTLLSVKAGEFTELGFRTLVEDWHLGFWAEASEFYSSTVPNTEAKEELDKLMFEFVKKGLLK